MSNNRLINQGVIALKTKTDELTFLLTSQSHETQKHLSVYIDKFNDFVSKCSKEQNPASLYNETLQTAEALKKANAEFQQLFMSEECKTALVNAIKAFTQLGNVIQEQQFVHDSRTTLQREMQSTDGREQENTEDYSTSMDQLDAMMSGNNTAFAEARVSDRPATSQARPDEEPFAQSSESRLQEAQIRQKEQLQTYEKRQQAANKIGLWYKNKSGQRKDTETLNKLTFLKNELREAQQNGNYLLGLSIRDALTKLSSHYASTHSKQLTKKQNELLEDIQKTQENFMNAIPVQTIPVKKARSVGGFIKDIFRREHHESKESRLQSQLVSFAKAKNQIGQSMRILDFAMKEDNRPLIYMCNHALQNQITSVNQALKELQSLSAKSNDATLKEEIANLITATNPLLQSAQESKLKSDTRLEAQEPNKNILTPK